MTPLPTSTPVSPEYMLDDDDDNDADAEYDNDSVDIDKRQGAGRIRIYWEALFHSLVTVANTLNTEKW